MGRIGEDEEEPAVPPRLNERDAAVEAFVERMKIDEDLVAAAAEASAVLAPRGADDGAARVWLAAQRGADKDAWLLRVLDGDGARLGLELRRRLRDETAPTGATLRPRRTSGALLQRAETLRVERLEREGREREEERRRRAAQEASERDRHLERLVGKDEALWKTVDALVAVKQAREYDQAVALLEDLRDLAAREGRSAEWAERFEALRQRHERLRALVKRLDELRR